MSNQRPIRLSGCQEAEPGRHSHLNFPIVLRSSWRQSIGTVRWALFSDTLHEILRNNGLADGAAKVYLASIPARTEGSVFWRLR